MSLPSMTVGGVKVQGLSDGTLPTSLDKVVDMEPAQARAFGRQHRQRHVPNSGEQFRHPPQR